MLPMSIRRQNISIVPLPLQYQSMIELDKRSTTLKMNQQHLDLSKKAAHDATIDHNDNIQSTHVSRFVHEFADDSIEMSRLVQ
jgi:hypothetical protein